MTLMAYSRAAASSGSSVPSGSSYLAVSVTAKWVVRHWTILLRAKRPEGRKGSGASHWTRRSQLQLHAKYGTGCGRTALREWLWPGGLYPWRSRRSKRRVSEEHQKGE